MSLKQQDILVLLKLVAIGSQPWSYVSLSQQLGISSSQIHAALKRAVQARLAVKQGDAILPNIANLQEFLIHGVKYAFVAERGEMSRGMPTAHAAPPLDKQIMADDEPPPIWPDPEGEVRGIGFSPLGKSAPQAARLDPALYELLALVDAIRAGRARERDIAARELSKRLEAYG